MAERIVSIREVYSMGQRKIAPKAEGTAKSDAPLGPYVPRSTEPLMKERPANAFLTVPLRAAFDAYLEKHRTHQADVVRWALNYVIRHEIKPFSD